MKMLLTIVTTALLAVLLTAGSSFAQPSQIYASVSGGVAAAADGATGDVLGEVGVRLARHLYVFGDVGQFHNLQPSGVQSTVDGLDTSLAAGGLSVTGNAHVPAWYSMGGLRWTLPVATRRVAPYVFGGAGFARLTPSATFTYTSGTLLGAITAPVAGEDVTPQIESLGDFTAPPASTAFMFSMGGGVDVPIAPHLVANAGYRVSRINADTPVSPQSITFGLGYRF
jgi:opacity protein-like surface antigen